MFCNMFQIFAILVKETQRSDHYRKENFRRIFLKHLYSSFEIQKIQKIKKFKDKSLKITRNWVMQYKTNSATNWVSLAAWRRIPEKNTRNWSSKQVYTLRKVECLIACNTDTNLANIKPKTQFNFFRINFLKKFICKIQASEREKIEIEKEALARQLENSEKRIEALQTALNSEISDGDDGSDVDELFSLQNDSLTGFVFCTHPMSLSHTVFLLDFFLHSS